MVLLLKDYQIVEASFGAVGAYLSYLTKKRFEPVNLVLTYSLAFLVGFFMRKMSKNIFLQYKEKYNIPDKHLIITPLTVILLIGYGIGAFFIYKNYKKIPDIISKVEL